MYRLTLFSSEVHRTEINNYISLTMLSVHWMMIINISKITIIEAKMVGGVTDTRWLQVLTIM
jgi:hypothetical protein